jgi:hypothetical protein
VAERAAEAEPDDERALRAYLEVLEGDQQRAAVGS